MEKNTERKLIGLTGPSSFTDECKELIEKYLNYNYILLYHDDMDNLRYWLTKCDAFIVAGGVDIHPTIYERNLINNNNLSKFDFQRDLRELVVIAYAIDNDKPMLGICRGHQMIGLFHGMKGADFCMDLCNVNTIHQPTKSGITAMKGDVMHFLELTDPKAFQIPEPPEREILRDVMGEEQGKFYWVNSFHHQGILFNKSFPYKENGVQVLGLAAAETNKDKDNVKIVELMRGKKWISCQWHPEWDYDVNTPSKAVVDAFNNMLKG